MDAIVESAARVFVERGYAAATTNHVARRAGVSIGSLYQYFPSKEALVTALEERHLAEASAALRRFARSRQQQTPSPEAWARAFVATLVRANDQPVHLLLSSVAPGSPRVRAAVERIVDEVGEELAPHQRRWTGQASGARARIAVAAALALVHEVVITAPAGPARRGVQREVARLVARALAP